jgi:hypothetical protein
MSINGKNKSVTTPAPHYSKWQLEKWLTSIVIPAEIAEFIRKFMNKNGVVTDNDIEVMGHLTRKDKNGNNDTMMQTILKEYQDDIMKVIEKAFHQGLEGFQNDVMMNNSHQHKTREEEKNETKVTVDEDEHDDYNDRCSTVQEARIEGKFDGLPTLTFDNLDAYFGGLECIVGPPRADVAEAMEYEHTNELDSDRTFRPPNFNIITTSRKEWTKLKKPKAMEKYFDIMQEKNKLLEKDGHQPLTEVEIIALRSYTGPMYRKYNAVTRGLRGKSLTEWKVFVEICGSLHAQRMLKKEEEEKEKNADYTIDWKEIFKYCNCYRTTLHAINSGIIKLSKLTKVQKVYRGIGGRSLPETFNIPNQFNVKGGVELGFMSTSTNKDVALDYAKKSGCGRGILFEIKQGMVDRGADLQWLSQHPEENEILFPPLTGIEVQGKRIEGPVVIIEVGLSVNHISLTIEQVVGKRLKLLQQMMNDIMTELNASQRGKNYHESDTFTNLMFEREVKNRHIFDQERSWYNVDDNFIASFKSLLELKKNVTESRASLLLLNKTFSNAKSDNNECKKCPMTISKKRLVSAASKHFDNQLLVNAARHGFFDLVRILLDEGAIGVNTIDEYGGTTIGYIAASCNEWSLVDILLGLSANIEGVDDKGNTPLISASFAGNFEIVEKLIAYGANIDVINKDGYSPITSAFRERHMDVVDELVKHGADPNLIGKFLEKKALEAEEEFLQRRITMADFYHMDVDESGSVTYDEFIKFILVKMNKVRSEEMDRLKELFDSFDENNCGTVEMDRLSLKAKTNGESSVHAIDKDGDFKHLTTLRNGQLEITKKPSRVTSKVVYDIGNGSNTVPLEFASFCDHFEDAESLVGSGTSIHGVIDGAFSLDSEESPSKISPRKSLFRKQHKANDGKINMSKREKIINEDVNTYKIQNNANHTCDEQVQNIRTKQVIVKRASYRDALVRPN